MNTTIDMLEDEIGVRETSTIFLGEDAGAISEVPQLEETNMGILSHPEEEIIAEGTFGDSSVPLGQEEDSSSRSARGASPADGGKGKGPIEEGDESDSDVDPEDLKMIDERTTHIEVRIEEGGWVPELS